MCTLDDILDEGSKFQYSMFISFPQFIYCSHDEVYFPKLSCLIAADGADIGKSTGPRSSTGENSGGPMKTLIVPVLLSGKNSCRERL